jgi:L-fuconate dehydratase
MRITGITAHDIRFPTSLRADGSDAMHPDPDYSAAYAVLETDGALRGHGLTFTIGRGNELCVAAIESLAPLVVGRDTDDLRADPGAFWRAITGDTQLRWVGPDKGVVHLGAAALVNAVWDLLAREHDVALWQLLCALSPAEVVSIVDWTYVRDFLDPGAAREQLEERMAGREPRMRALTEDGYPAYTTTPGWLGYPDDQLVELSKQAVDQGFAAIKYKVGADLDRDRHRLALARDTIGSDLLLLTDANQRWGVATAIEWVGALREFDPYWIEEPTHPDDVLGHAEIARALAPIRVATGEMGANQVMFKQFLQARALGVLQLDACRLGGVNEAVGTLLLAAHAGVPVCPHAGGVGLCQYVQHLAAFDVVAVSATTEGRMTESATHLHEHFVEPIDLHGGRYWPSRAPGYSVELRAEAIAEFAFPHGSYWRAAAPR